MNAVARVTSRVLKADRSIGAVLIDAGRLTPLDAERILRLQRDAGLRFGDAGLRLGLLTEADILFALSEQFDYPYLEPDGERSVSPEVVAAYRPFSAKGEKLRALRSQLQLRWFDERGKRTALAIVGSTRGEGRSVLAANLAVTFSQQGERTLLIDGDMRAPRQHKLFRLDNAVGLSNLLAGRIQDHAVKFVPGLTGLAVMTAGTVPPNPVELLSRRSSDRLFEQTFAGFDVVLIDTPALESGVDAMLLARIAGCGLVVARTHTTRMSSLHDMMGMMADSDVTLVGSVLVDAPPAKSDAAKPDTATEKKRSWWRR